MKLSLKFCIMKFKKYFSLFLMLFLCHALFAQFKYEKEVRMKPSQVPAEMYAYVNSLVPNIRVRWYKQHGFENNSFEAKFKHKRQNYSVEFQEDGTLKDVEVLIRVSDINDVLFEKIDAKLKAELFEYRITRLQRQIVASSTEISKYFENKSNLASLKQNYEMVLWTRINNKIITYEYLFDSNAEILSKLRVIDNIEDNLIY